MDIEEVAAKTPEKIHKVSIDPVAGLTDARGATTWRARSAFPTRSVAQARAMLQALYRAFVETDASLAEINPLIVTGDGKVLALDAKINFDDNALFRHADIVALRDLDEEDPAEIEASKFDLSYISLDGNIGCLVNGAGLAMATMDIIKLYGGEPANFLDVGGGATDGEGHRSVQDHAAQPQGQGDPGQHLRRHHAVRRDRRRRRRGAQGSEAQGAAGRAPEGDQRGSRAGRSSRNPGCRSSPRTTWRTPAQKVVAAAEGKFDT